MAALEEIVVKIGADVEELLDGMKKAEKATDKATDSMADDLKMLTSEFRGAANAAGTWAAATVAAGAAAAAAIVATSTEQVTALDRSAQRLGESVEVLSAFAQAAKSAGLDQEQFTDALQQTNIQIADFVQTGGGGAFDLITQLGIDARALNELKPSEQLLAIAEAIKDIPESDALKFLDDIGSDNLAALLPILKQGGDEFRRLAQEATDAGLVIRNEDVIAIRLLSAELKKSQGEIAALGSQFTGALTPFIIVAVDHFKDLSDEGVEFVNIIDEGFAIATKVIGTFANGLQGIEIIFKTIELGASNFLGGLVNGLAFFDDSFQGFADSLSVQSKRLGEELDQALAEPLSSEAVDTFAEEFLAKVTKLREDVKAEAAAEGPIVIPVVPEIEMGLDTLDPESIRFFSEERLKEAVIQLRQLNKDFEDSQQTQLDVLTERFVKESAILQEARDRDQLTEEKFLANKAELNDRFREQQMILAQSDQDMLLEQRERELEALEGFLAAKLITETEFEERRNAVNREFSEDSIELAKKEAVAKSFFGRKTTSDVIDGINALGQINEKAAKAAFRVNQIKAVSDTIVSTAAGIQRAFADLPFPVALAAAVSVAASGVAQLATITSQSFEGGGGAPTSTAGGGDLSGGAVAAAPAIEREPGQEFDISGAVVGEEGATRGTGGVIRLEVADGGSLEEAVIDLVNKGINNGAIPT